MVDKECSGGPIYIFSKLFHATAGAMHFNATAIAAISTTASASSTAI
jgi:hypothetical protein